METCGINYKHFQDIERGVVNPSYLTLQSIAKGLNCTIRELIPAYGKKQGKA